MSEIILGHRLPRSADPIPAGTTAAGVSTIIYRLVDYEEKPEVDEHGRPTGRRRINIKYTSDNRVVRAKLDTFIAEILEKDKEAAPLAPSPLDVNCKEECYLVFQLSRTKAWQFGEQGDAFTTKQAEGDRYTDLWHVASQDERYPAGEPLPDGCRILYLTARCEDVGFQDGFNLRVDLVLDSAPDRKVRTKLIIDPDIRNPGGSGPPLAGGARTKASE